MHVAYELYGRFFGFHHSHPLEAWGKQTRCKRGGLCREPPAEPTPRTRVAEADINNAAIFASAALDWMAYTRQLLTND